MPISVQRETIEPPRLPSRGPRPVPPFTPRRLAVPFAVLALAATARADNWPQWRGPTNDGVCRETNLPATWDESKNVAWKLKLPGMAGSTPVVWGDRLFLTSEDGNDLVLVGISTDGKQLWKQKIGSGSRRVGPGGEGNMGSASPSTDGKHVFAFVGSGDLGC